MALRNPWLDTLLCSLTTIPSFVVIVVVVVVYDVSTGRFDGFDGGDGMAGISSGLVKGGLVKIAGEEYALVFRASGGGLGADGSGRTRSVDAFFGDDSLEIAPCDDVELAEECELEAEPDREEDVDGDADDVALGRLKCTVGG
jgi:hypothetical protein